MIYSMYTLYMKHMHPLLTPKSLEEDTNVSIECTGCKFYGVSSIL